MRVYNPKAGWSAVVNTGGSAVQKSAHTHRTSHALFRALVLIINKTKELKTSKIKMRKEPKEQKQIQGEKKKK